MHTFWTLSVRGKGWRGGGRVGAPSADAPPTASCHGTAAAPVLTALAVHASLSLGHWAATGRSRWCAPPPVHTKTRWFRQRLWQSRPNDCQPELAVGATRPPLSGKALPTRGAILHRGEALKGGAAHWSGFVWLERIPRILPLLCLQIDLKSLANKETIQILLPVHSQAPRACPPTRSTHPS